MSYMDSTYHATQDLIYALQNPAPAGGTNTIEFIFHKEKPRDRRATYVRAVCYIRTQKTDTHSTRLTAGANLIGYPGEVRTPVSDLTTMKLHLNSAISDVKSRYMCMDVKYFYLNNQIDREEYIMIQISMIPQEFVDKYNFIEKLNNIYFFARVTKGMYGIPQAGWIAHDDLVKRLEPYRYHTSSKNTGLWKHNSQPINFTLLVDDFGVKYSGKDHALHLKAELELKYKVTTDWEEKLYIGIALK